MSVFVPCLLACRFLLPLSFSSSFSTSSPIIVTQRQLGEREEGRKEGNCGRGKENANFAKPNRTKWRQSCCWRAVCWLLERKEKRETKSLSRAVHFTVSAFFLLFSLALSFSSLLAGYKKKRRRSRPNQRRMHNVTFYFFLKGFFGST